MELITNSTTPYISRRANMAEDVVVGRGSCVLQKAIIGSGVKLGKGCHVGYGSIVLSGVNVPDWAIIKNGSFIDTNYDWSTHKHWNR